MVHLSLLRQRSPLAVPAEQRTLLENSEGLRFSSALADMSRWPLRATGIQILQVNVGKLCNQTCAHCHVDAGPDRREVMTRETMESCLAALTGSDIPLLDITGGAPEMNPHFRWFIHEARKLGRRILNRCNLTILVAPGYEDLPELLAENRVEIIASLPCYLEKNTDQQRGAGVFNRSIAALRRLNEVGYGQQNSLLPLTLVYNPIGPSLPPPQAKLEAAYRRELRGQYGIEFTRLITITNMPISRFLDDLVKSGRHEEYMAMLVDAYNPAAVDGLMCRDTLSVGWDGRLYDCDFNQMLDLELAPDQPRHIRDFDFFRLKHRFVVTGQHCFGCTAGCGSGCQGAITNA